MTWTKEQDELLINRGKLTTWEIAATVGRSYKAVQQRMSVLRRKGIEIPMTGALDWSEEELAIFHRNVVKCTVVELCALLPTRSYASIRRICNRTRKFPLAKDVRGKNSWRFTGCERLDGRRFGSYEKSARNRHLEFSVTAKYLWNLLEKQEFKCALSGLPIDIVSRGLTTASPDRIDNSKGYVEGNIQWVHVKVNLARHVLSVPEFVDLCKIIARKWA